MQVSRMGLRSNAWHTIMVQRKACNILQLFKWIFMGWRHGGKQHDIAISSNIWNPMPGIFFPWNMESAEDMRTFADTGCTGTWDLATAGSDWRIEGTCFTSRTYVRTSMAGHSTEFKFEHGRMQKLRSEMMWSDQVNTLYRALLCDRESGSMHYDDDKRSKTIRALQSVSKDVYLELTVSATSNGVQRLLHLYQSMKLCSVI